MRKLDFFSTEQQDEFVANVFRFKENGIFLDVGSAHPIVANNTYALELNFNWTGYCFDLYRIMPGYWNGKDKVWVDSNWYDQRQAPWCQLDVTSEEFTIFLKNHFPKGTIVDYISVDVDMPDRSLSLIALERILNSEIEFKCLTFEHELHKWGHTYKEAAADLLRKRGFVCIIENTRMYGGGMLPDAQQYNEDWWVHKDHFDQAVLDFYARNMYYFDAVQALRRCLGNDYTAHRHSNQAYPSQMDYFISDSQQQSHICLHHPWKPAYNSDLI